MPAPTIAPPSELATTKPVQLAAEGSGETTSTPNGFRSALNGAMQSKPRTGTPAGNAETTAGATAGKVAKPAKPGTASGSTSAKSPGTAKNAASPTADPSAGPHPPATGVLPAAKASSTTSKTPSHGVDRAKTSSESSSAAPSGVVPHPAPVNIATTLAALLVTMVRAAHDPASTSAAETPAHAATLGDTGDKKDPGQKRSGSGTTTPSVALNPAVLGAALSPDSPLTAPTAEPSGNATAPGASPAPRTQTAASRGANAPSDGPPPKKSTSEVRSSGAAASDVQASDTQALLAENSISGAHPSAEPHVPALALRHGTTSQQAATPARTSANTPRTIPAFIPPTIPPPAALMAAPPAGPVGGAAANTASPDTPAPSAQLAPALFTLAYRGGTEVLTVRLQPASLGQVEVQITRPATGPATVTINVEQAATLQLLLQDQPALQRALDHAGVPQGSRLAFHLAPPAPVSAPTASAPVAAPAPLAPSLAGGEALNTAGFGANPGNAPETESRRRHPRSSGRGLDAPAPIGIAARSAPRVITRWLRAGLDITA